MLKTRAKRASKGNGIIDRVCIPGRVTRMHNRTEVSGLPLFSFVITADGTPQRKYLRLGHRPLLRRSVHGIIVQRFCIYLLVSRTRSTDSRGRGVLYRRRGFVDPRQTPSPMEILPLYFGLAGFRLSPLYEGSKVITG